MTPIYVALVVGSVVGWLFGFIPMYSWHSYKNMERENAEATAKADQEIKNAQIVTHYTDALAAVDAWHRAHPTRVRIPGCEGSPGSPAPSAEDVVFDVGGYNSSDRTAIDSGLLGNNNTGSGAN